jgi:hypothetical protein
MSLPVKGKATKRPITVEYIVFTGDNFEDVQRFCKSPDGSNFNFDSGLHRFEVWNEKESCFVGVPVGHIIIKGIAGEFYPCHPDVFAATYELEPENKAHGEGH